MNAMLTHDSTAEIERTLRPSEAPEAATMTVDANAAKILCADDDATLRQCYSKTLTRAGYAVTMAADGQAAWEALEREPYDLLITDNEMPRLDGEELVLRLRRRGMSLPVIVAASDLEFFLMPRNQWLEVAALLPKPFGLRMLADAVGQVLCAAHQVYWGRLGMSASPFRLGNGVMTASTEAEILSLTAANAAL